jgi:hypothetical protein
MPTPRPSYVLPRPRRRTRAVVAVLCGILPLNSFAGAQQGCGASPHVQHFGICRCKCVFIDVGANDGSTLMQWPRSASDSTRMSAGTTRRDKKTPGLRWHLRAFPELRERLHTCLGNASSSCFYGFEGNADFTPRLTKLQANLRRRGVHATYFTETLFAKADGEQRFHIDRGSLHLGSSIEAAAGAVDPGDSSRIVRSVDARRFLEELRAFSGLVAMKLDVEGYEYQLLEHLLSTSSLCGRLELLLVEWHEHLFGNATRGASERLSQRLEGHKCGVPTLAWV